MPAAVFDAGADKVTVNSAALSDPALIAEIAHRYGSQAVIVAIDAFRVSNGNQNRTRIHLECEPREGATLPDAMRSNGRVEAEKHGAGEIMLTSIDRDGMRGGFDCELTRAIVERGQHPRNRVWRSRARLNISSRSFVMDGRRRIGCFDFPSWNNPDRRAKKGICRRLEFP